MITEPKISFRNERQYVGIREKTPFNGMFATVDKLLKELRHWVKSHSIADEGPFFLRYHVCAEIYGLQLQETPHATQTMLTTYGRTISPGQNRDLWWPTDAGRLVWYVKMMGDWMTDGILRGPPPADGARTREPALVQGECTIVVAAFTGEVKTEPIE